MKHFTDALILAATTELKDANNKLNQTDRNRLRANLMVAIWADIQEAFDAYIPNARAVMTSDGIQNEFPHDEWGHLCVELNLKMKDPEFDLETAAQEYLDKTERAEQKKVEAAKKAAERELAKKKDLK